MAGFASHLKNLYFKINKNYNINMIEKLPIKEKDLIQSDTVENSGIEDKLGNQENSEKDFEKIKEEFSR